MARNITILLWMAAGIAASVCRADVVSLTNGDRLSGEIQKLEEGKLSLKDLVRRRDQIDWHMVEHVSASRELQIETASGLRLTGMVQETPLGLEIDTAAGKLELRAKNVTRIRPAFEDKRDFWRRLDGAFDFGYSATRGNSETRQSSVNLSMNYRAPAYRVHSIYRPCSPNSEDRNPLPGTTVPCVWTGFSVPLVHIRPRRDRAG